MRNTFVSYIGAGVALALCSMAATAAPPEGLLFEVAYEVSAEPVTYESVVDVAALADLTEHRMPGLSTSLVGDTIRLTDSITLVGQGVGVFVGTGGKPAGVQDKASPL